MKWYEAAGEILSRLPLERYLFRPPDRVEELKCLKAKLAEKATQGHPEPPRVAAAAPAAPEKLLLRPGVDAQRLAWQDGIIRGELWLLEGHLKNKCIGCGGDVECCFKHSTNLIDATRETQSMTTDPAYRRAAELGGKIRPLVHPDDVRTGKYADRYPALVIEVSELRTVFDKKGMAQVAPQVTLEQAKAEAAALAASEVEKRWQGAPPRLSGPGERLELPEKLEFFADSAGHIQQSMEHNGLLPKLEQTFKEAIARARGGK